MCPLLGPRYLHQVPRRFSRNRDDNNSNNRGRNSYNSSSGRWTRVQQFSSREIQPKRRENLRTLYDPALNEQNWLCVHKVNSLLTTLSLSVSLKDNPDPNRDSSVSHLRHKRKIRTLPEQLANRCYCSPAPSRASMKRGFHVAELRTLLHVLCNNLSLLLHMCFSRWHSVLSINKRIRCTLSAPGVIYYYHRYCGHFSSGNPGPFRIVQLRNYFSVQ